MHEKKIVYGGKVYSESKGYYYRRVYLHIEVWENAHGPLPEGWVVHHINGNKGDNRLENLQGMPAKEHMRLHHAGMNYQTTEHRVAVAKKNWARRKAGPGRNFICQWCGNKFISYAQHKSIRYCSKACGGKALYNSKRIKI
jgi:hypothetical protein